ncbi:M64 family metallopeptidase [uncultured Mediterranea sp.]|mgnify:FL=1|uniref:M64 family metallopeptidase n=1 Tax=uncultured Mediterranea sp. TaxID=1926662 RepID=UPI002805E364|nr:M64 family metallopeptidase [uncultured Mediterranea sp.]
MKKIALFLPTIWLLLVLSACSGEEKIAPTLNIQTPEKEWIIGVEANSQLIIKFTTTLPWQAHCNEKWIVLSSLEGGAGENSLRILANGSNDTGEERIAVLTLESGNLTREINIRQLTNPLLRTKQTDYTVSNNGEDINIHYTTNLKSGNLVVTFKDNPNWIKTKDKSISRALQEGVITLTISPNEERKERKGQFWLQWIDEKNSNEILATSEIITVTQEAANVGISTDYSQNKKVFQLQQHSQGLGIPLIFMGDGFLDKEIANGYYRQVIEKGVENFFTEEPVKSLRDYFDIWYINAVSANNAFGDSYSTTFSCWLEGNGSTLIEGNHDKVMEYAMQVPILKDNPELINEATCIVILNTEDYAGTCYFGFNDGVNTLNLAIGYCPMIYGMEDDMFRRVLCHECIGHGFAKLLDEYSYQEQGRIPDSEIAKNRIMQQMGWAANVDFTNNRDEVLWNKFLKDSRYQGADHYEEVLGVYEGACTYWSGAYRPTNESMMRSNTHGFNAPSREAIYKRIMQTAYGSIWEYDYETFVEFDQAHLPTPTETRTRATREEASRPFTPPVFTNKTISIK